MAAIFRVATGRAAGDSKSMAMNRQAMITHGFWFALTAAMFVGGSFLARSAASKTESSLSATGEGIEGGPASTAFLPPSESSRLKPVSATGLGADSEGASDRPSRSLQQIFASSLDAALNEDEMLALVLAAVKSTDPLERRRAFDVILGKVSRNQLSLEEMVAMRRMLGMNGADTEQWRLLDYAWGSSDPVAAVAHLDKIPERYRDSFMHNMIPGLASEDPIAALDLLAAADPSKHRSLTARTLEGLVDRDTGIATDLVTTFAKHGDPNATQYMGDLAREVVRSNGLEAGQAWAEALPSGELKAAALVPIAHELTKIDPMQGARWAEQFVDDPQNSGVFGTVVRAWRNIPATTDWVVSLPPGSAARRDGLSAVYGHRGATQPQIAVQDIISMPVSPDRDAAINGFVSGLAPQDGEAAAAWTAEIENTSIRDRAEDRVFDHYVEQEPEAAQAWYSSVFDSSHFVSPAQLEGDAAATSARQQAIAEWQARVTEQGR